MGKKTLVVDDNRDLLHVLAAYLDCQGFQVTAYESASEATTQLSEEQLQEFEFVVTDLEMPGIRGDEFALLMHLLNPRVKIMIVSGAIRNVSAAVAKIATLVEKPFSFEKLVNKMLERGVPKNKKAA